MFRDCFRSKNLLVVLGDFAVDALGDFLPGDLRTESRGDLLAPLVDPCPCGVLLGVDFLLRPLFSKLEPSFLGVFRMLKPMG